MNEIEHLGAFLGSLYHKTASVDRFFLHVQSDREKIHEKNTIIGPTSRHLTVNQKGYILYRKYKLIANLHIQGPSMHRIIHNVHVQIHEVNTDKNLTKFLNLDKNHAGIHTMIRLIYRSDRNIYIMGANNGASPRAHVNVITIIHSIANCAISNTFFSSFKLLQQSEVPWNCK